jgi:hypothetical protein
LKTDTLTAEKAAVILFGTDEFEPDDQFQSGADVCEALAAHFGFTAEDYERIVKRLRFVAGVEQADKSLPEGTQLVCPDCGHDSFTGWAPCDTGYHGLRVVIEGGGRVEDDSGCFDSESGDVLGACQQYSCQCGGVWDIEDLVAP